MTKIVIIGGSHAGIAAATSLKKIQPECEVVLIEKSDTLAFIPSTINLIFQNYFSFEDLDTGIAGNPEALGEQKIHVLLKTLVTEVDPLHKKVTISPDDTEISYDYLILAMGSENFRALSPNEDKVVQNNIVTYKCRENTIKVYEKLKDAKHVTIIGAGLIGLELAMSLAQDKTREVVILEKREMPLWRYFDGDILEEVCRRLPTNVHLLENEKFYKIQHDAHDITGIKLNSGETFKTDAVVLALNPHPNIQLIADQLDISFDGTITVNEYLQTSNEFIYAVGDLIKIPLIDVTEDYYLPLIGIARKQSLVAANNILRKKKITYPASQRTIGTELFGFYLGSTGLLAEESSFYGYTPEIITVDYPQLSSFGELKDKFLRIKIVYSKLDHIFLGAQVLTNSRTVLELINQFSMLVHRNSVVTDLLELENHFAPKLSPLPDIFGDIVGEYLRQNPEK